MLRCITSASFTYHSRSHFHFGFRFPIIVKNSKQQQQQQQQQRRTFVTLQKTKHEILVWGNDREGQLGLCENALFITPPFQRNIATIVSLSDKRWKKVRAGTSFSLALEENGEIWYWGLIASEHEKDISLLSLEPMKIEGILKGKKIVDIGVGGLHALAVSEHDEVYVWGDNRSNQLGINSSKKIIPEPTPLYDLFGKGIKKVSGGDSHSVALSESGEVWTWGEGRVGQLGHGKLQSEMKPKKVDTLKGIKIVDVFTGDLQTFFISDEGTTFVCGSDENYLFGLLRSPRWNPTPVPITLPEGKRIKKISSYHFQTLAIDEDGGLWTWGSGKRGLLGREDSPKRSLPQRIKLGKNGEEKALHIGTGYKTSLCFTDGGHLWVWGSPFFDEFQIENVGVKPKIYSTPHLIDEGINVLDLSCGFDHSIVLTEVSLLQ